MLLQRQQRRTDGAVENVWSGSGDYGYYAMVDDPYDLENPQSIVRTMKISKNGTVKETLRTSRQLAVVHADNPRRLLHGAGGVFGG